MNSICQIFDKNYNNKGIVKFYQNCNCCDVEVKFDLLNFDPNRTYAIHIHEFGDLRKGCESLGSHWNPDNCNHGSMLYPEKPRHRGDLINNFTTDNKGKFKYTYIDSLLTLYDNGINGRSIVIHDGIDDCGKGTGKNKKNSLLTGNSGDRIAFGIIAISNS